MDIKEYITQIPKVELHCHLDGSVPKATLEEILGKPLQTSDISVDMDCQSLKKYLQKFSIPLSALTTKEALRKAGRDFMRSLAAEHVIYVEARFAPLFHVHDNLSLQDVMEAVLLGLSEGERETGISYGLIACAMRHHDVGRSLSMFQNIQDYLGHGLVAVDIAGDEAGYSNRLFVDLFHEARRLGYVYTMHAGETKDVREVQYALDAGASRVGHGIALHGNADLIDKCVQKGLGIEMCPISNMHTKAIADQKEYPLQEFLKHGLLATINTDNRTVSNTSLVKEFIFLVDNFGINKEDVDTLTKNAIAIAFAEDNVKENLLRKMKM